MEWQGPPRVAFVVVTKGLDYPTAEERRPSGARYTRDAIRGMLQFMGCKPRHAYKAAQLVFQKLETFASDGRKFSSGSRQLWGVGTHDEGSVYVTMPRSEFFELVCSTLTDYNYKYAPSSDEIKAACSLKERRRHIIVLLCGTSGSGKSTLASILASRLGICTVLSTDSVRHMMRGFTNREEAPLLFASTYEAGEALRKQQALDGMRLQQQQQQQQQQQHGEMKMQPPPTEGGVVVAVAQTQTQLPSSSSAAAGGPWPSLQALSAHDLAIRGYKAQCELISEHLEQLICGFEARRQSLVVEGVHLHVGLVMRLLQRHPCLVPFLVYIKSEGKHIERMAVRAKYMTLDPNKNKYVKNMRNIRWIQDYLFRKSEKHAIPCVENTNIDRSVGLIHLTLLGCLKRVMKGEQVLDAGSSTLRMLHNEYTAVMESMAGMGPAAGAGTGTMGLGINPIAAAATASGSAHGQRESSSSLGLPAPPPPRALGSPRIFSRELAAAGALAAPTAAAAAAASGDGGGGAGVYGEAALVAAAAAAVAAAPRGPLHAHSSPQLDLPAQYQSCAEAAALLLSSPPQQQQYPSGRQSAPVQARAKRRSSCGVPPELPSPSPSSSSPHSGLLLLAAAAVSPSAQLHPASPFKQAPGSVAAAGVAAATAAAARDAGLSPRRGSSAGQGPTFRVRGAPVTGAAATMDNSGGSCCLRLPEAVVGHTGLDSIIAVVAASPPTATLLPPLAGRAEGPWRVSAEIDGDVVGGGGGGNGSSAGTGTSPVCGGGTDLGSPPLLLPPSPPPPPLGAASGKLRLAAAADDDDSCHRPHLQRRPAGSRDQQPLVSEPGARAGSCTAAAEGGLPTDERQQRQDASYVVRGDDQLNEQGHHLHHHNGCGSGAYEQPYTKKEQHLREPQWICVHSSSGRDVHPQRWREPEIRHPNDLQNEVAGASDTSSWPGDVLPLAPGSPVGGAPRTTYAAGATCGVACASPGRNDVGDLEGAQFRGNAPAATAPDDSNRLLGLSSAATDNGGGGGCCGGAGDDNSKVPAAAPLAAAPQPPGPPPPQRGTHFGVSSQALSPEQQQHVEAVLPACMERLGAGRTRPAAAGVAACGSGGGSVDSAAAGRRPLPPVPLLARIEEDREGADTDGLPRLEGSVRRAGAAAAGSGSAATPAAAVAAIVAAASAGGVSTDRAASAAFAAAKDAYSRFGDRCPEEVLRAVMESAILDEQMDGVTEQQQQQQQQQQTGWQLQHPGSPVAIAQVSFLLGAAGGGQQLLRGEGHEAMGQGPTTGVANSCVRCAEQPQPQEQQQQHCLEPGCIWEAAGMDGAVCSLGAAVCFPPAGAGERRGGGGTQEAGAGAVKAISAFAGPNAWTAAAAAAHGAPLFLRTSSRRLGEESSSPSRSGYSSDEAGVAAVGAGCDGEEDGGGGDGHIGPAAGRGAGTCGGGVVRRRRPNLCVGSLGTRPPGDSDDPEGETYGVYGHGSASPLQEYGSVYESATHDDMDEHGDDEEGVPLGRSNTIIRHLAGALERSRMRASASATASAAASAAMGRLPPHAQHHLRANGPPPASSSGAALRLSVSRKSGVAGGQGGGPHADPRQQHQQLAAGGKGSGGHGGVTASPVVGIGMDQQLRQLLRVVAGVRVRTPPEYSVSTAVQQTQQ